MTNWVSMYCFQTFQIFHQKRRFEVDIIQIMSDISVIREKILYSVDL